VIPKNEATLNPKRMRKQPRLKVTNEAQSKSKKVSFKEKKDE
jgi:hypothetical protein